MEMLNSAICCAGSGHGCGCGFSSKGGDASGEGANGGVDPNAGYGANSGAVDGSLSDEAALRAITTFYFEYDSSDLKPEAMRALTYTRKT